VPIIGYRYRCKSCPNHDICEACYERWDGGKGSMANGLAKQTISLDPKDHDFYIHKERGFKPLVKTQGPTQKSEKKLKVREGKRGVTPELRKLPKRRGDGRFFLSSAPGRSSSRVSSSFLCSPHCTSVAVFLRDPEESPTTRALADRARSSRSAAGREKMSSCPSSERCRRRCLILF
jgi:hypothetical protein